MDPFHHRDRWDHHSYSPPYFSPSRSQSDLWRISPLTPRPSNSPPSPTLRLNSVRNITPPEGEATLGEEQCAVVKEFKSPYDQAHECIDRFKKWRSGAKIQPNSLEVYESNLSIKMSMHEWIKLRNDLNIFETDKKFPRYSYNSSTSTFIVQFMPSPVHESITSIFTRGFHIAQESLPYLLRTRISTVANQEFNGFGGRYTGSNKTPDLAVEFEDANGNVEPKFVLEVGFSETYNELVQDARMWLEGSNGVSILVLAKIEETPKYRCPVRGLDNEDFEQLGFPGVKELKTSDFSLEGEYGPATYKGLSWVGQISATFMEIWKKDPMTGLATRSGSRIDLLAAAHPPQVEFQLSDFLDIDPDNERTIPFQWDDYRHLIKKKIQALAMFRCREMLKDRSRLEEARDLDYIPSDSSH